MLNTALVTPIPSAREDNRRGGEGRIAPQKTKAMTHVAREIVEQG
jgi:hypothetical protein